MTNTKLLGAFAAVALLAACESSKESAATGTAAAGSATPA